MTTRKTAPRKKSTSPRMMPECYGRGKGFRPLSGPTLPFRTRQFPCERLPRSSDPPSRAAPMALPSSLRAPEDPGVGVPPEVGGWKRCFPCRPVLTFFPVFHGRVRLPGFIRSDVHQAFPQLQISLALFQLEQDLRSPDSEDDLRDFHFELGLTPRKELKNVPSSVNRPSRTAPAPVNSMIPPEWKMSRTRDFLVSSVNSLPGGWGRLGRMACGVFPENHHRVRAFDPYRGFLKTLLSDGFCRSTRRVRHAASGRKANRRRWPPGTTEPAWPNRIALPNIDHLVLFPNYSAWIAG